METLKNKFMISIVSNCSIFANLEVMKEIRDVGSKKQGTDTDLEFLLLETLTLTVAKAESLYLVH